MKENKRKGERKRKRNKTRGQDGRRKEEGGGGCSRVFGLLKGRIKHKPQ